MDKILADAIVVIHVLFIIFVICGGLLVLRWPKMAIAHLPAVVWGAAVEIFGWICPLTPLENRFRDLAGETAYSGDFIGRYLLPVIYPENLTADIQYILGGLVITVNAVIYFIVVRRHRKILIAK